jgi:ABC-2 type transport system permease protein
MHASIAVSVLFRRSLLQSIRSPYPLLAVVVVPLVLLWLFDQVFGGLQAATTLFQTTSYLQYLAPAAAVSGVVPAALLCGRVLFVDRESGLFEQLLAAPVPSTALLFGTLLATALCACVSSMVVLAVSLVAGLQLHAGAGGLIGVASLGVTLGVLYAALACALATISRRETLVSAGVWSLLLCSFLGSTLVLPESVLPGWLTVMAGFNPVNYAIEAARALARTRPDYPFYLHNLLLLCCLATAAVIVAMLTMRRDTEAAW